MNLSEIEQRVLDFCGETNYDRYLQIEVDRYINNACKDIASIIEYLEGHTTEDTTSGIRGYSKPANAIRIKRIEYNNELLEKVSREYLDVNVDDWEIATGAPSGWYPGEEGGYNLYPIPDGVYTLTIHYSEEETKTLSGAGDTPDLPDIMGLHLAICWYAAASLLTSDDQDKKASTYWGKVKGKLNQVIGLKKEEELGKQPDIKLEEWS